MITRVTITGADDSIHPAELLPIQREYPFVEWGILFGSSPGRPRFPSEDWQMTLSYHQHRLKATNPLDTLQLSGHLCGRYSRLMLMGLFMPSELPHLWPYLQRIQINTHAEAHSSHQEGFERMAKTFADKEFIFQYDDVNTQFPLFAAEAGINYSVLFDLSHGVGKLPSEWPDLLPGTKCGYAGGLSPDNLRAQIERIEEKAGDTPIWIDMETHVRSKDDTVFDLGKVRQCLAIAAEYVTVH